jgi:hypothetical protein
MTCHVECKRCGRPIADVRTEGILDDVGKAVGKIVNDTGNTVNNVAKSVTNVAESVKNATEENLLAVFDKLGDIAAGNDYGTKMRVILNQYNQVTRDYIKNGNAVTYESRRKEIMEMVHKLVVEIGTTQKMSRQQRVHLLALCMSRLKDMTDKNKKMIMAK